MHTSPDYAELIRQVCGCWCGVWVCQLLLGPITHIVNPVQAATPGDAKRMGASRAHPIQGDWDAERDRVMERAVEAKFTQHPHLRQMLLDTGDARLREHTRRDRYWGDGGDANTGLNKLGKILMRLRTQLQQQDGVIDSSANAAAAAAAAAPAAPAASAASAASAAAANYSVQTGNLLEAKEQYLVQQCNSVSKSAKGLSAALFKKFKFADVYASRAQGKRGKDQPGTISVHRSPLGIGPSVVNLFGQVAPGTPKGGGSDNAAARLAYFQQGLAELAKLNPESVAFPFQIGCGLGGGSWPDYERALRDFAAQVGVKSPTPSLPP